VSLLERQQTLTFALTANWISFLPLIRNHDAAYNGNALTLITQGLFGIFLCLMILLGEKLIIQVMYVVFSFSFSPLSRKSRLMSVGLDPLQRP
jgi:uncharacterized membrane protein